MSSNNSFQFMLRTLRYRNYRLFFIGQAISLIGTWMQQIAVLWLAYRLTNSTLLLGLLSFASQIPAFVLTPIAGVYVDRWNRQKILVVAHVLLMLQAFALTFLYFTGSISIWHLVVLGIAIGLIGAFEMPARHAFIFEIVEDKQDVGNAIALNSSIFNLARLIGPVIAGMLIAYTGEGICFFLNAVSYVAVLIALIMIKVKVARAPSGDENILRGMKDGISYAFKSVPIRNILILVGITSLMGMPYPVLVPAFAREVLGGGPKTFGFLMAASGVGALTGALYLAARRNVMGLGRMIALAACTFGMSLIFFSLSTIVPISMIFMFMEGLGMMVQLAACNTILQTIVDDEKRGRIMSLYTTAFIGLVPFGSLFLGSVAGRIGPQAALMMGGMVCVMGAVFFALKLPLIRAAIRPIYAKKGIIRAEREAIEETVEMLVPPED